MKLEVNPDYGQQYLNRSLYSDLKRDFKESYDININYLKYFIGFPLIPFLSINKLKYLHFLLT